MSSVPVARAAPSDSQSTFFWIKHDGSGFARCVRGSVTIAVPLDRHDAVLSSEFEDWCLDNLVDGLLVEWRGTQLRAHFASKTDSILFKLRWL